MTYSLEPASTRAPGSTRRASSAMRAAVTPEPGRKNTANSSAASHADSGREPSYHV